MYTSVRVHCVFWQATSVETERLRAPERERYLRNFFFKSEGPESTDTAWGCSQLQYWILQSVGFSFTPSFTLFSMCHIQYVQTYISIEALDHDTKAGLNSYHASRIDFLNAARKISDSLTWKLWEVEDNLSIFMIWIRTSSQQGLRASACCLTFNVMPALTLANPLGCIVVTVAT